MSDSNGKFNFLVTIHEMGHAFDIAHAEMWTETSTDSRFYKDPAGMPQAEKNGQKFTEYVQGREGIDRGVLGGHGAMAVRPVV